MTRVKPSMLNNLGCHAPSNFQPIELLDPACGIKFTYLMTNSADPDQLASLDLDLHTRFAKAGHILVQQDQS